MTTDRDALVDQLSDWEEELQYVYRNGLPLDSRSLLRLVADCKAALTAQGGEQTDTVSVPREQIENMLKALRFYANGHHFGLSDPDAWDTVSGEPQNYYCDEAGTATVEDGSIAAAALRGEPADWLDGVEDCSPKAIKGELSILAAAKEGR